MPYTRDAIAIYFADEAIMRRGEPWSSAGATPAKDAQHISRITVAADLPGLHCNMERVRVWVGDVVVFEAPLHMVEGVEYPLDQQDEPAPAEASGRWK